MVRSTLRSHAKSLMAAMTAMALLVAAGGCDRGEQPSTASTTATPSTASAPTAAATPTAEVATSDASSTKGATRVVSDTRADASAPAKPGSEPVKGDPNAGLLSSTPSELTSQDPAATNELAERKPGPAIRFEPEVLDMGEMLSDTSKTMSVRLVNITGEPVIIRRAVPSCGCTTLGAPKDPIAPGDGADVEITLKPGLATGVKLSKKVTFEIEGYMPQVLTVEGDVAQFVSVEPQLLTAPPTPDDASAAESGSLKFTSTDGTAFAITGVNPSVMDGLPTASATEHQVSIDWAKWEEAKRPIRLTFTTDHPKAPTVSVSVRRSVRDPRAPTPPTPDADRPTAAAPTGTAALIAAARAGDAARVRMEVANGTNVNAADPATSRTAIHWAAQEGKTEVITALLESGADVGAVDRAGMGPLAMAAKAGQVQAVEVLIAANAPVNIRDAAGGSPLLWAAGLGNSQTVAVLIAAGAEVNITDVNGLSPLLWATSIGRDADTVRMLLDAGADANQADRLSGDTPAIRAAKNVNPEVLRLLVAKGVDLSKGNLRGTTAVMNAAGGGGVDQVRILIEAKADLASKDARGWTALDYALNRSDANRDVVVEMIRAAGGAPAATPVPTAPAGS